MLHVDDNNKVDVRVSGRGYVCKHTRLQINIDDGAIEASVRDHIGVIGSIRWRDDDKAEFNNDEMTKQASAYDSVLLGN